MNDAVHARRRIEDALSRHPALADRILRALLIALHQRGLSSIDQIHEEACARCRAEPSAAAGQDENASMGRAWDELERAYVRQVTIERAADGLSADDVDDIVNLARKREEARTLEEIANLSSVSFRLLADKVRAFCRLPRGSTDLPESEAMGVRAALIRHFVSDQPEFIGIARNWLRIRSHFSPS